MLVVPPEMCSMKKFVAAERRECACLRPLGFYKEGCYIYDSISVKRTCIYCFFVHPGHEFSIFPVFSEKKNEEHGIRENVFWRKRNHGKNIQMLVEPRADFLCRGCILYPDFLGMRDNDEPADGSG